MTPEQWRRVTALLARALELDAAAQKRLVEQECPDDSQLRAEVFGLLTNFTLASLRLPWLGLAQVSGAGVGATMVAPSRLGLALEPGDMCGRYEVVRLLGAGAMGRVYLATDTELSTPVALKILSDALLESSEARIRLRGEAHYVAKLRGHPHIATLLDLIHVDVKGREFPVIVMEYVEGMSCAAHLENHPVSLTRALRWATHIADAVDYAHDRGVLHCDLKPQNIQVTTDDNVKVLDFGISRALYGPSAAEVVAGTPAYMAPEQITERRFTEAGDIYSFGVTLFELVTRQHPFVGDTLEDLVLRILGLPAPKASSIVPGVPPALDSLLERTLAKLPRQRPQSMGELRRELAGVLDAMNPPPMRVAWWAWAFGAALTLTVLGLVTSVTFDNAFGRTGEFRTQVLSLPWWGFRSMVAPAATLAAVAIVVAATRAICRLALLLPGVEKSAAVVARWKTVSPVVLGHGFLLVHVAALGAIVWAFWSPLATVVTFAVNPETAPLERLWRGNEQNALAEDLYGISLSVLWSASVLVWAALSRRTTGASDDSRPILVAAFVTVALTMVLYALPFRIFFHDEAERVTYGSERCYLAGRSGDRGVLFCPLSHIRRRVVVLPQRAVVQTGMTESVFSVFGSEP